MLKPHIPCMLSFELEPSVRKDLNAQFEQYNSARTTAMSALRSAASKREYITSPSMAAKYLYPILRKDFGMSSLYTGVAAYSAFYTYMKEEHKTFDIYDPMTIPTRAVRVLPDWTIKIRVPFPNLTDSTEETLKMLLVPSDPGFLNIDRGKAGIHLVSAKGEFFLAMPRAGSPKKLAENIRKARDVAYVPKSKFGLLDSPALSVEEQIDWYTRFKNQHEYDMSIENS